MTKQEAIKKAYLEVGIPFNEKVLYDSGWLKIKPSQYSRPKSLSGIENTKKDDSKNRLKDFEDIESKFELFKPL
jgi:hypothetical protein